MKYYKTLLVKSSHVLSKRNRTARAINVILIIWLTTFALSMAILLISSCNPVSLKFKAWDLEYQLQKEGCENASVKTEN
ncbi:MAG TPA: hypothetical protein VK203_05585 [Nostocaceae cyanobacterium]|nr:hypothetical protein [Nostocaceae cyanobacterium]